MIEIRKAVPLDSGSFEAFLAEKKSRASKAAPVVFLSPGSFATIISRINTRKYMSSILTYRHLNAQNVKITITNIEQVGQKKVSCLLLSDRDFSTINSQYVNEIGQEIHIHGPTYEPIVNELCLVCIKLKKSNETNWYRARAVKWVDKDRLIVQLIDTGSHRVVERSSIRKFIKEFLFDVLALNCIIPDAVDSEKLVNYAYARAKSIRLIDTDKNIHEIVFDWTSFELPKQDDQKANE